MVNFFVKFLSEPTVVLGLVAMIGLIAMKNRPSMMNLEIPLSSVPLLSGGL